ncbi:MAG: GGDEF domain-containing protein [Acidobacteriaceae bacterium]|nr:GGDEF domain-containing protein [Acidobacteriaceae bacterium]
MPGTLVTLRAVHELSHDEAAQGPAVAFEATVTYYSAKDTDMFVQDGNAAVYVQFTKGANLIPGDRVLVEGHARDSFRPDVVGDRVTLLRHDRLPEPIRGTFDQMVRGKLDCMRVKVRGVVRSADMVTENGSSAIKIHMVVDGGYVDGVVVSDEARAPGDLLDNEVEVTAVVAGSFDSKMQLTGILLEIPNLSDIRILRRASTGPWTLPLTPMDQILSVYHVDDQTQRVRVHGVITYYQPGAAVVLQDGPRSIWISTRTHEPLQLGDEANATGFPESHDNVLILTDGEIQDNHISSPIKSKQATWQELGFWSSDNLGGHQNDLVSIEGEVTAEARLATQDEYVLVSDGRILTAIYHHPPGDTTLLPLKAIPLGSKVKVTGICSMLDTNSVNPGEESSFNILLRSFDDITVVDKPSLVNVRSLLMVVGFLLVLVLIVGARGWLLDRKVKRQAVAMAARVAREAKLERHRSTILEDIHGKRPLEEILHEITNMVSFRLDGAPCWFRTIDGPQSGIRPADLTNMRVVREQIPVRSVSPLAEIFVALDADSVPGPTESEIVSMAAGLAFLAIESRRVYSELFHRSEFDLLTGLHNRFSFERRVRTALEEANQQGGIHGLIYIDLDQFKSINDRYGHRVGDMYLQEASLRMKRQLRNVDMLARYGGDEFTAFISTVRSKTDVADVTERLKQCFDEPFYLEGFSFQGSASVGIAMYPEDGESMTCLLSTADAEMYVAKQTRGETEREVKHNRS